MRGYLIESYDSNMELMDRAEYLAIEGIPIPDTDPDRQRFGERMKYWLVQISDTPQKITGFFRRNEG